MSNKKKKQALASYITVNQIGVCNASSIKKTEGENLFKVSLPIGERRYYVFTKKEAKAREFETFESCYYSDFKDSATDLYLQSFAQIAPQSAADATIPTDFIKAKKTNHIISQHYVDWVEKCKEFMFVSPEKAFKDMSFFKDSKKQYNVVNGFYIQAE